MKPIRQVKRELLQIRVEPIYIQKQQVVSDRSTHDI